MPTTTKRGPGRPRLSNRVRDARRKESAAFILAALDRLDVDPPDMAALLGLHPHTVRRWRAGRGIVSVAMRQAIASLK